MKNTEAPKLRRVMRLPHATAMVVGTIIGAAIFVQPSEITGQVPSVGWISLVWLIAGILTFFGALVCAELSSIFTQSGGVYIYLKEAFSPSVGFLWGWSMFWIMHSGIIAAIAVIFARYVGFFVSLNDVMIKVIAIAVILLISAINYLGVKQGSTVQTLFTLGKVGAIVLIVVLGFVFISKAPEHFVTKDIISSEISINHFFLALVAGLFAFGGWHMVTYNSEETINPRKTIPRALMLGTVIVTVCYIYMNAVYMRVLPLNEIVSSTRIAAKAANVLFGYGGGSLMSALVIFSTFGALTGIILSGPRVYYSMARDGLLFRWVGAIHKRYRTPHRAIIIQAVWASFLVATGTYRELFTRVVYTEWVFFGLMTVGLFLLRRKPGISRGFSVWLYPVIPGIFIFSSAAIVIHQIISKPWESILGLSMVLVGLPVYLLWMKKYIEEFET
jgi:APA family basic amino acid/polyamine antiporter